MFERKVEKKKLKHMTFPKSNKVWNWLVVSSKDPAQVASTVRGFASFAAVQAIAQVLPFLGIHVSIDFASAGDALYTIVYGGLSIITLVQGIWGGIRKLINSFKLKTA